MKPTVFPTLLAAAALAACNSYGPSYPTPPVVIPATFTAIGDSTTVAATLSQFRAALGGSLNAPNTPATDSGRREINWDGVPAALTNVDTFPANFFNVTSKRGALFTGPGTGFRVDSTEFGAINAGLAAQFTFFSAKKLFMPVGSNVVEVFFDLVGTQTPGLVNGFGVVFSDVDRAGSTHVTFYDSNDVVLANLAAPGRAGAQEFSFVGAVFPASMVHRVVIISGDAALSGTSTDVSAGGTSDLVVMDDFIYGEPQPLP